MAIVSTELHVFCCPLTFTKSKVRFALSSGAVFCRTDQATDSEFFYDLVIDLLEDEQERQEVDDLIKWWNR